MRIQKSFISKLSIFRFVVAGLILLSLISPTNSVQAAGEPDLVITNVTVTSDLAGTMPITEIDAEQVFYVHITDRKSVV